MQNGYQPKKLQLGRPFWQNGFSKTVKTIIVKTLDFNMLIERFA